MMKKIFFGLTFVAALTACTDDYKDWAEVPSVPQPATVSFGDGSVSTVGVIDLNSVTSDKVQVCNISAPSVSEEGYTPSYVLTLGDGANFDIAGDGTIATADLQKYIVETYSSNPVQRDINAVVSMWVSNGTTTIKTATSAVFQIKAIPQAPEIEQAYYLTGTINDWVNTDTTYKLTNDGSDPYTNPTFTLRIPAPEGGANVEFKMTPESGLGGDWSGCLSAGSEDGKFAYKNAGGNLVIEGVEGASYYDLTFNMLEQTWSYKALLLNIEQAYYLTGTINGWNNSDTTYKLTNDGSDPYENPTFTLRIPAPEDGSNVEFKMTPESGLGGDWSKCLAAGSGPAGTFAYNNDGGNLVIEAVAGAKYYDITFNMMELTWTYKAVAFEQFVYFIGATDGWKDSDQRVEAVSDGVYTGYIYIADPNGWGVEFKFQKRAGDWADDSQLNSNNMAEVTGDFEKTGDNFKASAGEGVYYVELDLTTNTLKGTLITNMNLVGDFNGWNAADDSQQMTWDAENFCYVITGAGVTANGWKFTTNNSWDINLGGDTLDNLVANGANISAVGSTIKLYPTRKTSDKIYCTVE